METPSSLLAFSSQPYLLASVFFTLVCLATLFPLFVAASSKFKPPPASDDCGRCDDDTTDSHSDPPPPYDSSVAVVGTFMLAAPTAESNTGASMMEQLVPEITTHALSYLDYPSLCRLSMTNSLMRRAANDDNAWKALYHKNFTLEQDSVTPVNGWKAYYAATRAILNVNSEFFDIIRERSVQEMSRLWLNADYVKCFHASGELFSGYNAVIQSWQLAFNWDQGVDFLVRRWYMVHHHSSVMFINGDLEHQNVHG